MTVESVAQDQLRAFVERIERMDEELAAINDDKREIYAEAKGNGFDVCGAEGGYQNPSAGSRRAHGTFAEVAR